MSEKNKSMLDFIHKIKTETDMDLLNANYLKEKIESLNVDEDLYAVLIENIELLLTTTYKPYIDDTNSLNSHFINNLNIINQLDKNDIIKIRNEDNNCHERNDVQEVIDDYETNREETEVTNEVKNEVKNEVTNEVKNEVKNEVTNEVKNEVTNEDKP